jgi:alanine racemase
MFIADMFLKGCRNFIVSNDSAIGKLQSEVNYILVKDTRKALQQLAGKHRNRFTYPIIGITGSNGKTIVKEWLYMLMNRHFKISRSPKSYNSQIGVPLSLLSLDENFSLGIIEAGTSTTGEMELLSEIVACDIGVFTSIGDAHDAGFSNRQEKIEEKAKLFKYARLVIYCRDETDVHNHLLKTNLNLISWSTNDSDADLFLKSKIESNSEVTLNYIWQQQNESQIHLPFNDLASVKNASTCLSVLAALNLTDPDTLNRFENLDPVEMRLRMKSGINNCTIINDYYNADINALKIALDVLDRNALHKSKTVILSDLLETGRKKEILYKELSSLLLQHGVKKFIGIGKDIKWTSNFLKSISTYYYDSTEEYLNRFSVDDFRNEIILLKAARSFRLERVSALLEPTVNTTVLEINLEALDHNLSFFASRLKPETKLFLLVKAGAYGSGSRELARFFESTRADYLGVAIADEGKELRKAGISLPIMVLNPGRDAFDSMITYDLEPEIYSLAILKEWIQFVSDIDKPPPIHLKIDTGMHRLGFLPEEIDELLDILYSRPFIRVRSIFSHLAASDDPSFDEETKIQIAIFEAIYQKISSLIKYNPIRHILNTNGILRFPEYQFDMARLGIGLYGAGVNSRILLSDLHSVHSLRTQILQIKDIPADAYIGYNPSDRTTNTKKIAIIGMGYGDGLDRRAGNGAIQVIINKKKYPTIGNICMDMTMVDISGSRQIKVGDSVQIFGETQSLDEYAKSIDTIAYEVISGIAPRVRRIYVSN